jgi:hypothetical protein
MVTVSVGENKVTHKNMKWWLPISQAAQRGSCPAIPIHFNCGVMVGLSKHRRLQHLTDRTLLTPACRSKENVL